mmetsp:Transcript_11410/g.32315  ORF Transcript_11410/g.32315 Transcript_11410/m.32315 type:complete len:202 (-) Transcript_11410:47-652(-)
MAEEEWIAATQETLGKLISKPKMTDKYLKKPPFRFLHDIVMEVTRTTGFGQNLYTTEECDAQSLDKGAKVEFLNKAISVVSFALGEKIEVSANKVVAGLEADKTNHFLQKLTTAAQTCVGAKSDEAVQRVLNGESASQKKEKKKKEEEPAAAPAAPPAAADGGAAGDEEAKKEEEAPKEAPKEEEAAPAEPPKESGDMDVD